MPIYEFRCSKCNKKLERIQKMTDPPPQCEVCRVEMQKQISASNFELKGGGWAKDGYSS